MERPNIEGIKSNCDINFIYGSRQTVSELIEYIEQLEKEINTSKIGLDLINYKIKGIIEYKDELVQALKIIYNIVSVYRNLTVHEKNNIYVIARNTLGGIKND